jgi:plastocyanin
MGRKGLTCVVAALGLLVAAVSAFGAPERKSATPSITVGMTEFKFALSRKTARRGTVLFRVTNRGAIGHDFKIAGKKTRILPAGGTARLSVTFRRAGRYRYLGTVPSHAPAGMRGVFVVR